MPATMKRSTKTALFFAVLLVVGIPAPVVANSFSCKDAKGNQLFDSSPPPGCVGEICETKSNGATECLSPPETAEQKEQREAKKKKKDACRKKMHDSFLDDLRFMDKYPRRAMIDQERDGRIATQQERINGAQARRKYLRDKAARLSQDADFYSPKHPMPPDLRADIEASRKLLVAQEALLARYESEMRDMNERYDQMLRRWDKLHRGEVEPVDCDK